MRSLDDAFLETLETKKRNIDLEKEISKSPVHSVLYARDVIGGRFLLAEENIGSDPYFVCAYLSELELEEVPDCIHRAMLSKGIESGEDNEKNYWIRQYFKFCDYIEGKESKPWWFSKTHATNWNYGKIFNPPLKSNSKLY